MYNNQKTLFLFLLLFIQNLYPMIDQEESEDNNALYGSAYKEMSSLHDSYYGDINSKTLIIPTRPKSPSLGKYNLKIPQKFIPLLRIIEIKEVPEETQQ